MPDEQLPEWNVETHGPLNSAVGGEYTEVGSPPPAPGQEAPVTADPDGNVVTIASEPEPKQEPKKKAAAKSE